MANISSSVKSLKSLLSTTSRKIYPKNASETNSDDGKPDVDEKKGRDSFFKRIKNIFGDYLTDSLAEYGPPYEKDTYYDGALLFECSQINAKALEVHRLLNAKVDPNDRDPNELGFTALHWCARHCHFLAMKMLIRAKADVNEINEFWQSPLSLCVMMKQTVNKLAAQREMAEYLLDVGADIEIRDKSGMSPLDYAVINENIPLIKLFLDYGAKVRRDNTKFTVQRLPLLDFVKDQECYDRIERRLEKETAKDRQRAAELVIKLEQEKQDRACELIRQQQQDRADRKAAKIQRENHKKMADQILKKKLLKLQTELDVEAKLKAEAEHSMGSWSRDKEHHWNWQTRKDPVSADSTRVYEQGMKIAQEVKDRRSVKSLNKRWEEITGAKLEVKWETMKAFDDMLKEDQRPETNKSGIDKKENMVLAFDYKDQNDKELDGEDLELLEL